MMPKIICSILFSFDSSGKPIKNPGVPPRFFLWDGAVRWHQWSDRAIFNESGVLAEYQSVGRDITDWKTIGLDLRKKNYELYNAYEQRSAWKEEFQKQL